MQQICFVITPACRYCKPTLAQKHYCPCIGCQKPVQQKINKNQIKRNNKLHNEFTKMNELKQQGFSLRYISKELNIPRSTVFYVLKTYEKGKFL
jgi:hypothetical protein